MDVMGTMTDRTSALICNICEGIQRSGVVKSALNVQVG